MFFQDEIYVPGILCWLPIIFPCALLLFPEGKTGNLSEENSGKASQKSSVPKMKLKGKNKEEKQRENSLKNEHLLSALDTWEMC